jgi:hypothetical protein
MFAQQFGFQLTCDMVGVLSLTIGLVYLFFAGGIQAFKKTALT